MLSNYQQPSEALDHLLAAIAREAEVDAAGEEALARRARAGDGEAARGLVTANLRRVLAVARGFRNKGLPLEDLVHEGALGLLEATRTFDPDRRVRFFTYASFFVRRSLVAAIARGAKTVRVPRHLASRLHRARESGTGGEALKEAGLFGTFEVSTDERADRGRARTRGETLVDRNQPRPDADLLEHERLHELHDALGDLPARERTVLAGRFGLGGDEPRTLRDLGAEMRLSKERVRQLEDRAKESLRERLSRRLSAPVPAPR